MIRAVDFLEHVPDKVAVFNELYRVLAPNGLLLSLTPSTDGRGAFQDPTHVAFYNENSFWYYTERSTPRFVRRSSAGSRLSRLVTLLPDRLAPAARHQLRRREPHRGQGRRPQRGPAPHLRAPTRGGCEHCRALVHRSEIFVHSLDPSDLSARAAVRTVVAMSALVQSRMSDREPLLAPTADDACTSSWDDARLVAEITAAERQARAAAARVVRLTAEFARRHPEPSPGAHRRRTPASGARRVERGLRVWREALSPTAFATPRLLSQRFPKLLDAWEAGLLNVTAVRRVLDVAHGVPESVCARLESDLLRRLGRPTHADLADMTLPQMQAIDDDTAMTVSSRATTATVGRITRDLVARLAPEARAERVALARARRRVTLDDGADGMSWLSASLTQATAWASFEHVDALARALPEHPDDDRSLDAKRADVLRRPAARRRRRRSGDAS